MSSTASITNNESKATKNRPYASTPLISPTTNTDALTNHCAYLLPTLDSLLTSNPNLQLLDVGCGSGRLTTDFALLLSRTQPGTRVTGIDISAAILESAKFHSLARGVAAEHVRYLQGSALALPFPAHSFDVVHAHQVLSHVSDPVAAVREMARVVRPGGAIFLREGDLRSVRIWPEGEVEGVLKRFFEVLIRVQVGQGAVADGGARLSSWVEQAGLKGGRTEVDNRGEAGRTGIRRVEIDRLEADFKKEVDRTEVDEKELNGWKAVSYRIEFGSDNNRYDTRAKKQEYAGYWPARCMGGMFAEKAIELGVKSSELEQYAKAWKKWIEDDGMSMAMAHGYIIVRF